MDLSTTEGTIAYLKKAIPREKAYEFILYAIPLLYELFNRMDTYEMEVILCDDALNPLYGFIIDIMTEYKMQETENERKEKEKA